jgi:hypothetical protein
VPGTWSEGRRSGRARSRRRRSRTRRTGSAGRIDAGRKPFCPARPGAHNSLPLSMSSRCSVD